MRTLTHTLPRLAWIFSDRSVTRFVLVAFRLYYFYIGSRLGFIQSDVVIPVQINGCQFSWYLREVKSDLAILEEVFIRREYAWQLPFEPRVIIDLGAHFGDTALYYHSQFPDAKIIAVEPFPDNFKRLEQQVSNIPQIIPVQAAIGSIDGEVTLHVHSGQGHSVIERVNSRSVIHVPQLTLSTLYELHGLKKVDLIKFDIEGAEFDLFSRIKPQHFSHYYIGEVHFDLATVSPENFYEHFSAFDYVVEKIKTTRVLIRAVVKSNSS